MLQNHYRLVILVCCNKPLTCERIKSARHIIFKSQKELDRNLTCRANFGTPASSQKFNIKQWPTAWVNKNTLLYKSISLNNNMQTWARYVTPAMPRIGHSRFQNKYEGKRPSLFNSKRFFSRYKQLREDFHPPDGPAIHFWVSIGPGTCSR